MIYLIFTASLYTQYGTPVDTRTRVRQYMYAIKNTLTYLPSCIVPVIVENNGHRKDSTCLEEFIHYDQPVRVVYTSTNQRRYPNKGVNEWFDLLVALDTVGASNDDIVIKMTGRYTVHDSWFFDRIVKEQAQYDTWFKFYNVYERCYDAFDCVLGMFAMRALYVRMLSPSTIGLYSSPEAAVAKYVRLSVPRVCELMTLGLECLFADDSTEQWQKV